MCAWNGVMRRMNIVLMIINECSAKRRQRLCVTTLHDSHDCLWSTVVGKIAALYVAPESVEANEAVPKVPGL